MGQLIISIGLEWCLANRIVFALWKLCGKGKGIELFSSHSNQNNNLHPINLGSVALYIERRNLHAHLSLELLTHSS